MQAPYVVLLGVNNDPKTLEEKIRRDKYLYDQKKGKTFY
jgi:hypothetical protein